jgi:uncharacterized protein
MERTAAAESRKAPPRPWYREPWPWILMTGPAIAIVASVGAAIVAFTGADGLVADDYYKQGLAINRTIAREEAARGRGISGELRMDAGVVRVSLTSSQALPDRLTLTFTHPARASRDRVVQLARLGDGDYVAPLPELGPGRWRAIVETPEWRIAALFDPRQPGAAQFMPGVR